LSNTNQTPTKLIQPATVSQQSTANLFEQIKKVTEMEKQMASRPSTSLTDMEMIRRLKRLEKFEL
jgi:hypothetical protein